MSNNSERRQRLWDAVYSAVFADLWRAKAQPLKGMTPNYSEALKGVSSDAARAADDALAQLDAVGDWGPKESTA